VLFKFPNIALTDAIFNAAFLKMEEKTGEKNIPPSTTDCVQ
jgi:hypothetical protein